MTGRFIWRWLPPLAWMGLIFFFSSQSHLPRAPGPWLDMVVKKSGHAFAFGVLAWLYLRALRPHLRARVMLRLVSLGLAVAYAVGDEYHQTFVLGRKGRLSDVMVDAAGACGAMLVDWWLARRSTSVR